MELQDNKVFVQIGTHDGKDEFNHMVRLHNPSKVILVDPYEPYREVIFKNYEGVNNVFLESVAITEVSKKEVVLVHPQGVEGQPFYNGCFSLLPMDDWGKDFKEVHAPGMTFMELCKKYELKDIHYLQIDTEGYDAIIIQSIDFTKVNIDIIKYEKWNFPTDCFKRHGVKKNRYGVAGMKSVALLLQSLGYTLYEEKEDMVAIKTI